MSSGGHQQPRRQGYQQRFPRNQGQPSRPQYQPSTANGFGSRNQGTLRHDAYHAASAVAQTRPTRIIWASRVPQNNTNYCNNYSPVAQPVPRPFVGSPVLRNGYLPGTPCAPPPSNDINFPQLGPRVRQSSHVALPQQQSANWDTVQESQYYNHPCVEFVRPYRYPVQVNGNGFSQNFHQPRAAPPGAEFPCLQIPVRTAQHPRTFRLPQQAYYVLRGQMPSPENWNSHPANPAAFFQHTGGVHNGQHSQQQFPQYFQQPGFRAPSPPLTLPLPSPQLNNIYRLSNTVQQRSPIRYDIHVQRPGSGHIQQRPGPVNQHHQPEKRSPKHHQGQIVNGNNEEDYSAFAPEDLINRRMFREAANNITQTNRQLDFPLCVIAYPLLCGGHGAVLEKYVARVPELQVELMGMLEHLFCQACFMRSIIRDFAADVCRPQQCMLNHFKLKKVATTWVHLFGIDPFVISFIYKEKCQSALMYLFRNATFEDISVEAWIETVVDLVKPFPDELRAFTLLQLAKKKNNEIMGRLMEIWEIDVWDGRSADELKTIPAIETKLDAPVKQFHPLGVPRRAVEIVSTPDALHAALKHLEEQMDSVIGIDCEWNSSRTGLEVAELALMQVATRTNCYLLDIYMLKRVATDSDWKHLSAVMRNSNITKLGFDASQDIQMMSPYLPGFHGDYHQNNIIDLKPVSEHLVKDFPDVFGVEKGQKGNPEQEVRFALANVVERVLGAPLAKLERMSNWEGRPLREAQIIYAATDAHCLIEVYDKLTEDCKARNIPFPPKPAKKNALSKKEAKKNGQLKNKTITNPAENAVNEASKNGVDLLDFSADCFPELDNLEPSTPAQECPIGKEFYVSPGPVNCSPVASAASASSNNCISKIGTSEHMGRNSPLVASVHIGNNGIPVNTLCKWLIIVLCFVVFSGFVFCRRSRT